MVEFGTKKDSHLREDQGGEVKTTGVGIDPGKSGAIAVIAPDGYWGVIDMPETNLAIYEALRKMCSNPCAVALEQQNHRGLYDKLNGAALTTFMSHYGALQMALAVIKVEPMLVNPKTWQAALLGPLVKGETKDAAMEYAQRNIPKLKIKKSQADAVCLALYAQQSNRLKGVI